MTASVIIPAYRSHTLLQRCVDSVLATRDVDVEVIVVANGADADTLAVIDNLPPIVRTICLESNAGFAGGVNAGLAVANGTYLALLNDDTEVEPGWLAAAIGALESNPTVGIVGAKIRAWDRKTLEHAGGCIHPRHALTWHHAAGQPDQGQYDVATDMEYVTGAALVFPRRLYDLLGPLEPSYFMYYEEVEYCLSARRLGYKVRYEPAMVVYHLGRHGSGGLSRRYHYMYHRSRLRFVLRNYTKREILRVALAEAAIFAMPEVRTARLPLLQAQISLLPELPAIWLKRRKHLKRIARLARTAQA